MGHKGTFSSSRDLNDFYSNNPKWLQALWCQGTILRKWRKWQIFLAFHLFSVPLFIGCRGCILFQQLTSGGVSKESSLCRNFWISQLSFVVMGSVTPQDTLPRIFAIF